MPLPRAALSTTGAGFAVRARTEPKARRTRDWPSYLEDSRRLGVNLRIGAAFFLSLQIAVAGGSPVIAQTPAPVPSPNRPVTDPATLTSPSNTSAAPIPLADLTFTRGYQDVAWSVDGNQVFLVSNLSGRFNLWRMDASGSWPIQLVQSDDQQSGLAVSPDGAWVVFTQDRGGNEYHDIYAVRSDGSVLRKLTNTPDIDESAPVFAPGGRRLAMSLRVKGATNANIAILDFATEKVRLLTAEQTPGFNWIPIRWTPDGQGLIANRANVSNTVSSVWFVDASTGAAEELARSDIPALVKANDVSADGRTIAISSNAQTGQLQAGLFDRTARTYTWLNPTEWEQSAECLSPDGRVMLVRTNVDGREKLDVVDIRSGKERPLVLPDGVNKVATTNTSCFALDGRQLLVFHTATNAPGDIFVADIRSGKTRPLTNFALASLGRDRLPASHIVTYRSFDGSLISAVLAMPFNLKRDGTNPAVIIPHGGPKGQSKDVFDPTVTALASRGYIVIAPNFRGSLGYGRIFQGANQRDLGGGDLKDVLAAKDFLVASGYVDGSKVGIAGSSYGGFLTLMALGRAPDAFAAAVERYGILDWSTLWSTTDASLREYQRDLLGGDPVSAAVSYRLQSPMTYLGHAKAPLLSLHGENDVRVPTSQTARLTELLRSRNVVVETHSYSGEGHGFRKRENQTDALGRLVSWFDKYLKGTSGDATELK